MSDSVEWQYHDERTQVRTRLSAALAAAAAELEHAHSAAHDESGFNAVVDGELGPYERDDLAAELGVASRAVRHAQRIVDTSQTLR